MNLILICPNQRCLYYEVGRIVVREELGQDVFVRQVYECVCGAELYRPPQRNPRVS